MHYVRLVWLVTIITCSPLPSLLPASLSLQSNGLVDRRRVADLLPCARLLPRKALSLDECLELAQPLRETEIPAPRVVQSLDRVVDNEPDELFAGRVDEPFKDESARKGDKGRDDESSVSGGRCDVLRDVDMPRPLHSLVCGDVIDVRLGRQVGLPVESESREEGSEVVIVREIGVERPVRRESGGIGV